MGKNVRFAGCFFFDFYLPTFLPPFLLLVLSQPVGDAFRFGQDATINSGREAMGKKARFAGCFCSSNLNLTLVALSSWVSTGTIEWESGKQSVTASVFLL